MLQLKNQHLYRYLVSSNKNISVFQVMDVKILGRVGTLFFFFFWKKNKFMHFERLVTFQNA